MQEFSFQLLDNDTFCITGYEGDEANVIIPPVHGSTPVTILYDDLFKGHSEITSVSIPDTVTSIGSFVFYGCTALKSVTLPESLQDMWQYAFAGSGIEEIVLPKGLVTIASFTFQDCVNLTKVVCNPGLKKIHAWAFSGCDKLKQLIYEDFGLQISPLAFEAANPLR